MVFKKNEKLLDRLIDDWKPVSVAFESDTKTNQVPDILSELLCLVLSSKAKSALESLLPVWGFLPLEDGFWLFNCLDSIGGDSIDAEQSSFR